MNISLDSISMTSPGDALALFGCISKHAIAIADVFVIALFRTIYCHYRAISLISTGGTRSRASVLSRSRRSATLPKLYISTLLHG